MKSKRRHDLQTNQLADWIGKKIEAVKPYTSLILLGTLVAVVIVVGVTFLVQRGKSRSAKAWGLYTIEANMNDPDPAALTKVAQTEPDSPPHLWALLAAADAQSSSGMNLLYTERGDAVKQLESARETYEAVIKRGDNDLMQRRARLGLAKTLEALGKTDAARQQYEKLASTAKNFAVGKFAEKELRRLSDPSLDDFYKQFADVDAWNSQQFAPTFLPDRPDISFPGDMLPLPERPDITFPEPVETTSGGQFDPGEGTVDAATN